MHHLAVLAWGDVAAPAPPWTGAARVSQPPLAAAPQRRASIAAGPGGGRRHRERTARPARDDRGPPATRGRAPGLKIRVSVVRFRPWPPIKSLPCRVCSFSPRVARYTFGSPVLRERAVATIRKTPSATWKAVIRKRGWPTVIKTFRTKRDAEDWARRTEDEMVRGVYIDRAASERLLLKKALERYEAEVCPTKRPSTARREKPASANLKAVLGDYSLAAITPDLVAGYRDQRLEEGLSAIAPCASNSRCFRTSTPWRSRSGASGSSTTRSPTFVSRHPIAGGTGA